ncbi:hypothetical protein [Pediococcus pentosaceus]|uniref:hypothetical protein n=1 Tax=Pediococcus pentosaceus TaxID=1255 RepID=UPI001325CFD6|nr:hypothetical protein [Pediococcus pentosaceus]KAF0422878.1 hypothetical protein GBO84_06065 [Pediococcus pentosaceus]KAF0501181.1 hypothetical protein GBP22_09705 [Pediococcus pentosaceus]
MKLVRVDEDIALDIDDVQFAVWRTAREDVLIGFKSNSNSVTTVDKKVLDAICGSEEQSVEYEDAENYRRDNNYNIIIGNDNGWERVFGTRSKVLSLLNQLKNNETLTIKRTK